MIHACGYVTRDERDDLTSLILVLLYPNATPAFQVPPATCELVES